jgi:D-hydroxyproline dehydrogenase subunit alpha
MLAALSWLQGSMTGLCHFWAGIFQGCSHQVRSKIGSRKKTGSVMQYSGLLEQLKAASSLPGVYVAGDVTGVGGKPLAEMQGQLAAFSALELLGKITSIQAASHYSPLKPLVQREQRFSRFLWKRYRLRPGLLELADDDTLFCFCEAVPVGAVRACIQDGGSDLFGIKLRTRLGMGNCQGRYCIPNAALFIAAQGGKPVAQLDLPSIRPPIYTVRMKDIAAIESLSQIELQEK